MDRCLPGKGGGRMKVMFLCKHKHIVHPEYYPKPGTIGVVMSSSANFYSVRWPDNSVKSSTYEFYVERILCREVEQE